MTVDRTNRRADHRPPGARPRTGSDPHPQHHLRGASHRTSCGALSSTEMMPMPKSASVYAVAAIVLVVSFAAAWLLPSTEISRGLFAFLASPHFLLPSTRSSETKRRAIVQPAIDALERSV